MSGCVAEVARRSLEASAVFAAAGLAALVCAGTATWDPYQSDIVAYDDSIHQLLRGALAAVSGAVAGGIAHGLVLARFGATATVGRRVLLAWAAGIPTVFPWLGAIAIRLAAEAPFESADLLLGLAPLLASSWLAAAPLPALVPYRAASPFRRATRIAAACGLVAGASFAWDLAVIATFPSWFEEVPDGCAHVVVAAAELPAGTTLTARHLAYQTLPRAYVLPDTAVVGDPVLGRRTASRILEGEALLSARLQPGPTGRPFWDRHWTGPVLFPPLSSWPRPTALYLLWARDLPVGHLVGERDWFTVSAEEAHLPRSVGEPAQVLGMEVCEPVWANEPVRPERLAPRGTCR